MPRADLVGVCDLDLDRAKAAGVPSFTDLGTMLEAVKPDIVDIILPPAGHAAAIQTALASGVTAIICQKPFCSSILEARAMTDLAAAAGIPLIIHENFRCFAIMD